MPTVLAVMAHPDDIEILCAGTLILLKEAGWDVHLATMTAGDLGSMRHSRPAIAKIRRKEAAASASLLGAGYTCLGFDDLTVAYSPHAKRVVTGLLRAVEPDLLVLHSPDCYMADHTESARIAREAAFASTIPNWKATWKGRPIKACAKMPAVLYADPIDHVDALGRRVRARYVVDITSVLAAKEKMLSAHDSQRRWLREQHGEDEYLLWMRRMGADRARDLADPAVQAAEGFVPHLGHGFPRDHHLGRALGSKVRELSGE
ncbi:MAG TPA: PIG-L family deacetylase [Planctomycetota bacterium]|nr:PIG-L family deacetylase [Planctomycetota bacterium]